MTEKEAIKRIKMHNEIHSKNERFAVHITEALEMAIAALEKQVDKKPLPEQRCCGVGQCPNCNAAFIDNSTKHCGNCGQKLDWGEAE